MVEDKYKWQWGKPRTIEGALYVDCIGAGGGTFFLAVKDKTGYKFLEIDRPDAPLRFTKKEIEEMSPILLDLVRVRYGG